MKKLVVLTGAGISAESGLKTFRDSDGLWENYNVYDVATPQAWQKDPDLVQQFYNERRKQVLAAEPNRAHTLLKKLEEYFDVRIITQNIDNLHERSESKSILHLHGEITKARSTVDPALIVPITGWELKMGDKCSKGSQLRPHIVWFGEAVPKMEEAVMIAEQADILLIIGTSLQVYPAASLVEYIPYNIPVFLIDPNDVGIVKTKNLTHIKQGASLGLESIMDRLVALK